MESEGMAFRASGWQWTTVWTDDQKLISIQQTKQTNQWQAQWALFFKQINFHLSYCTGSKNTKADVLLCQYEDNLPRADPTLSSTKTVSLLPSAGICKPGSARSSDYRMNFAYWFLYHCLIFLLKGFILHIYPASSNVPDNRIIGFPLLLAFIFIKLFLMNIQF